MILALQEFIYKKLNTEIITNRISGIFYQVPANTRFPYIHIGDFYSKDRSTKDKTIAEISFILSIYSRDKTIKPILELVSQIKELLNSNQQVIINFEEEKLFLQNDGLTTQINLKFRAFIGAKNDI